MLNLIARLIGRSKVAEAPTSVHAADEAPLGNPDHVETELQPCTEVWGSVDIQEVASAIERHVDVMALPFSQTVYYHNDPGWGVYGADGRLIDAAALRRGAGQGLVGQSLCSATDFDSLEADADEANYVYGGLISQHFGHFIINTLARLWWLAQESIGNRKILFHSHNGIDQDFALPFIATCFDRLGLNTSNTVIIDRPMKLRKLTIPRPSFEDQSFGAREFQRLCHKIGEPFWDLTQSNDLSPVYLSKTRLGSGVGRFKNEQIIEDRLREEGVVIIYPETMPFSDQVKLFSQKRNILGSAGSAFHAAIFSPPLSRKTVLSGSKTVNSDLLLCDALNGDDVKYVYPKSGCSTEEQVDGFYNLHTIAEPHLVAEEMVGLAYDYSTTS